MLKVRVELHPFGSEEDKREIETLYIANVGVTGYNRSMYDFWINHDPRVKVNGKRPKPDGHLPDFDRSRGSLQLIGECMQTLTKPKDSEMLKLLKSLEKAFRKWSWDEEEDPYKPMKKLKAFIKKYGSVK